eukprot:30612-Eustigmatos_ZCMA.PRE.1
MGGSPRCQCQDRVHSMQTYSPDRLYGTTKCVVDLDLTVGEPHSGMERTRGSSSPIEPVQMERHDR